MANGPDGRRFVWGRIKETHVVGPYSIVEFTPTDVVKREKATGLTAGGHLNQFHPYVDGQDTSNVAPSLDGALCLAIAFRGGDISMGRAMMKLVAPEAT
jgi:hypothetical protein